MSFCQDSRHVERKSPVTTRACTSLPATVEDGIWALWATRVGQQLLYCQVVEEASCHHQMIMYAPMSSSEDRPQMPSAKAYSFRKRRVEVLLNIPDEDI